MEVAQEINRIYCNGQIIVEWIRMKHKKWTYLSMISVSKDSGVGSFESELFAM